MYKIQTLNKISQKGLDLFPKDKYEMASEIINPDAILLRSFKMHDMGIPESVKAVARAGAGVNNIPIDKCTERGIVVFNTPGANANAVKELVLAALFMASRDIFGGKNWVKTLVGKGDEVPKLVEAGKSQFAGYEIKGKTLGVIGLGAIGVMVANSAASLGMNVIGYDPYISVEAAWGLSRAVRKASSLEMLLSKSDFVTLHVPLVESTKGYLNAEKFAMAKKGISILNFARGGLVNNKDVIKAIKDGIVSKYVTDFPDEELIKADGVLTFPHLGASTYEAEENCAVMAVEQTIDYLENGNIKNSVNFPECRIDRNSDTTRIVIANKNIPNMVSQITQLLADEKINISEMVNKNRGDIAYNIIDTDSEVNETVFEKIRAIEGVFMTRILG